MNQETEDHSSSVTGGEFKKYCSQRKTTAHRGLDKVKGTPKGWGSLPGLAAGLHSSKGEEPREGKVPGAHAELHLQLWV